VLIVARQAGGEAFVVPAPFIVMGNTFFEIIPIEKLEVIIGL